MATFPVSPLSSSATAGVTAFLEDPPGRDYLRAPLQVLFRLFFPQLPDVKDPTRCFSSTMLMEERGPPLGEYIGGVVQSCVMAYGPSPQWVRQAMPYTDGGLMGLRSISATASL